MQALRIIRIPDCKMVSTGVGMFGDDSFASFDAWFSALLRPKDARDFLAAAKNGVEWLYIHEEGMSVPERLRIIDFKGGLYAICTDIDGQTDVAAMDAELLAFLKANGFEQDPSRRKMRNVITPPEAEPILGYQQMDYYTPIRSTMPSDQHEMS